MSSTHADVDRELVHAFLSEPDWAKDVPRATFERARVTRDAHGLYAKHGWRAPAAPGGYMECRDPDVYARR